MRDPDSFNFARETNHNNSTAVQRVTSKSGQEPAALDTLTKADVKDAVQYGLLSAEPVRKLLHAISEAGCTVDRGFFHVLRCSAAVGGGFAPEHGVILCHNRLHTRREVLNAMTHELIHAYDHCRFGGRLGPAPGPEESPGSADCGGGSSSGSGSRLAPSAVDGGSTRGDGEGKVESSNGASSSGSGGASGWARPGGLDWSDCRQHACTEIRAANLSGDCGLLQELLRGNLPLLPTGWADQQRACVARRAALSVAMNPALGGGFGRGVGGEGGGGDIRDSAAAAVVAEMMSICLADTAPFDASEAVAAPSPT